jgi:hypothetical protein
MRQRTSRRAEEANNLDAGVESRLSFERRWRGEPTGTGSRNEADIGDMMKPIGFPRGAGRVAAILLTACLCCAPASAAPGQEPAASKPAAAGQFSVNDLPADHDSFALLTIPTPGRYAIRAKSASGARIQLVDMISGPGESSGAAGLRDGRIDALLDKGVYKLRVFGGQGASGKVSLTADAFTEADAKRATLTLGQTQSGELGDLSQRSYWMDVGPAGQANIEAVGRALQDLRLWRPSGELVDVGFEKTTIEPKPGRYMTRVRLKGAVTPGRYIVTAYGGEKLVWSDGAAQQPFFLRLESASLLAAGVAEGVIGPFGAVSFDAPADYDTFRLELPAAANARLEARRGTSWPRSVAIGKTNREPVATLSLSADGQQTARIEVVGFEGQTFRLRALRQQSRRSFQGFGPHLVTIDVAGEGGDEIPATALLASVEKDRTRVLASDMPRIAPGRAWRSKFNFRGVTSLLFEATSDGAVAIHTQGPKVKATIEPALGSVAPRADGRAPGQYDLQAGFYLLSLEPIDGAAGIIDVTLGAPGLSANIAPPAPARNVISFGEQQLDKESSYLILANVAPSLVTGPRVVALPADLEKGPLPLWQSAGSELVVSVRAPKRGKIVARDAKRADVALTTEEKSGASGLFDPSAVSDATTQTDARFATVHIAATDKPRALGLLFIPEAEKIDEGHAQDTGRERPIATIAAGRPSFFDLARDEKREFRFDLLQGGLYRLETLGRLQTALAVGANFTPRISEGEDNGPGHNAAVTTYLRAGSYRASVTAKESAGHLGVAIAPASLTTTTKLTSDSSARATLASGRGAIVPIEIEQDGLYRLDLQGLDHEWRARLEDADGWPLTAPGKLSRLTQRLEKGNYRLVVLPEDVEARMYARLRPVIARPALEGHGPHPLPFDKTQKLQWREPQAKNAPRAPDMWRFSLRGDADVEVSISEGMIADLIKNESDIVGKAGGGRKFAGRLNAGDYRLEARSLAHDDRLDYDISLTSKELQPGAPRFVEPPAALPFAIASDTIVDIVSFGDREIIGALKDSNGGVVERLQGRADDWNMALSRRLPAGTYTLELDELRASKRTGGETQSEETSENDGEGNEQAQAGDDAEVEDKGVEIRFALLDEANKGGLTFADAKTISGAGAHILTLPPAPQDSLMLVAAQSTSEVAVSIERRDANGGWRVVGLERGLAPVAAWPASPGRNGADEWRAVIWSIGGGETPITVAARAIERHARALGEIALEPAPIEGLASKICIGLAAIPSASLVDVAAPASGFVAGSTPGHLLQSARSGPLAPQSERLWLVSRDDCKHAARVESFAWKGGEIALDLGPSDRAVLPLLPAPSKEARLWLARSAFAQPGLDAGRGMDATNGAALALAGEAPLRVWNASGSGPLRVALQTIDLKLATSIQGGALYSGVVAPKTVQPVTIGADAPLAFDLAAGVAAFSAPDEPEKITVFSDGAAISRIVNNAPSKIWLVNITDAPLPARASAAPGKKETFSAGRAIKRFYGASGQVSYPIEGATGDRLVVIGGEASFVGDSGLVTQGASVQIDGRGAVTIDYRPGLVAFWIERNGKTPWPVATPRATNIPQRVTLEGAAMNFSLQQSAPAMLDVKSSAPAIVAFTQNGQRELQAFPAGVELHRYMSESPATLEIFSPHDGPLAGTLDITAAPVIQAKEGLNDPVTLAAGTTAVFSFETKRDGEIGLGLRSDPDRTQLRLLDEKGKLLGEGLAQSLKLAPGRYVVEARAPNDAPLSVVRLAIIGLSPPPASPPAEVVAELLEKAGLKKNKSR